MDKRKKLVVISHTEHYLNDFGQIVGWGATVNEINFLADYWEEIVHVGCFYSSKAPTSALPYTKATITFVAIPPYGGKTISDKLKILIKIPRIITVVHQNLKNASEVQLRLPTSMGLFLLPFFRFVFPRKYTFWVKYAGNWAQAHPPMSYRFQRWWLKKNLSKCKVTINGFWDSQPAHCLSFENPCLTDEQLKQGSSIVKSKQFKSPFTFVFVGRLEEAKGVSKLIEALQRIPEETIGHIHFIGDSNHKEFYLEKVSFLKEKVTFHGSCSSEKVHQLIGASHFLLLPSKSEGFPKVIAEAVCYGTIPVVSNVGSISHYLNKDNGFVWDIASNASYGSILSQAVETDSIVLKDISINGLELAKKFTFNHYLGVLQENILTQ